MGFVGITEFTNTSKLLWLTVHLMMLLLVEFGNSETLEECCTTHFAQKSGLLNLNFSFSSCVKKMKEIRQKCDTDETVCKIARQCSVKNLSYDECASIFQTLSDGEWTVSSIIASLEKIPEPNLNLFQSVTKYERWSWWDDFLDEKFETEFEMYKNIPDIVKNEHYKNKLTTYKKWWKKANKITDEEKNPTDREFICNYDEVKRLMDFDKNNKLTEEQYIQIFEKICIKKSKLPEELLKKVLSPPQDGDQNVEFNTVKIMLSNSKEMSDLLESIQQIQLSGQMAKIWNYKNSVRMIANFNEIEAPFKISVMASCISLNLKPDKFTLLWKHAHDKGLPRAVTKAVLEKLSLYKIINSSQEEEVSRKLTIFLVNVSEFYKKYPRKQDGMLNVLFMIKQASQRSWDLEKLNNFISLIPNKLGDDELIPFFQAVDANGNINILSHTIMFFKSFELNNIWRILIENDYTKNVNSFVNLDRDYPVVTPLVLKIILSSKNPGCTEDQAVAIIKDLTKQDMYESDVAVVEKIKSTCPDFVQ